MSIQWVLDHAAAIFWISLIVIGMYGERRLRKARSSSQPNKSRGLPGFKGNVSAPHATACQYPERAGGQLEMVDCRAYAGIDVAYSTEAGGPVVINNADGRRYRYLRDHGTPSWESWFQELRDGEITKEQADAEVDAEIAKLEVTP